MSVLDPGPGWATPTRTDEELVEALQDFVPEVMRVYGTPGLSVSVARHGRLLWEAGFGRADLASDRPHTADTTTRSGSMGKVYTATAVMQLVEAGVLELDAPVNGYPIGFAVTNPLGERPVTVRDLLTHRSGLAGNAAAASRSVPLPLAEHLAAVYGANRNDFYGGTATPMWALPVGQAFEYSNTGIATLGYLVEVTNPQGLSFSDYVQRHVLDPLRMGSSQYPVAQDVANVRPELWARLSSGYSQIGRVHVPTPELLLGDYPAGGLVTTASDHLRLLLAYQHRGALEGAAVLAPETVDLMLSPQLQVEEGVHLGLVWWLRRLGARDASFGHDGAHMWGWTNTSRLYPHLDVGVVVCTNHWDLCEGPHRPRFAEGERISDFVATWLMGEERRPQRRGRTWAWKVGYVAGLVVGDRVFGCLSVTTPFTDEDRRAMAAAVVADGTPLDPDGFRAGLRHAQESGPTLTGMRRLLDSVDVEPAELPLLFAELGRLDGSALLPVGAE
jgi:CubicO group peptidase (beta-lactamase class C family)